MSRLGAPIRTCVTLSLVAVALYPGSFDPVHLGHLAIIEYAAGRFDEVVVAVLANPHKNVGLFSPSERVELVSVATAHLDSVRCRQFYGLTVDLAEAEGADVLVRSAHKERGFEQAMAVMNRRMANIPTVYARVDGPTRTISSSQVRQLLEAGRLTAASQLVPTWVRPALVAKADGFAPATAEFPSG